MDEDFWAEAEILSGTLKKVFVCLVCLSVAFMVVPFGNSTVASLVINGVIGRFLPDGAVLLPLDWSVPLSTYLLTSFVLGFFASLPYIFLESYRYLSPVFPSGAFRRAWRVPLCFVASLAFGAVYSWYIIAPLSIRAVMFFNGLMDVFPAYGLGSFMELVFLTVLLSSLLFVCPVAYYCLVRAGMVPSDALKGKKRMLYGAFIIGISVIDADPFIITEALVGVPVIAMFEVADYLARKEGNGKVC